MTKCVSSTSDLTPSPHPSSKLSCVIPFTPIMLLTPYLRNFVETLQVFKSKYDPSKKFGFLTIHKIHTSAKKSLLNYFSKTINDLNPTLINLFLTFV